jgi:hypothetical protein
VAKSKLATKTQSHQVLQSRDIKFFSQIKYIIFALVKKEFTGMVCRI